MAESIKIAKKASLSELAEFIDGRPGYIRIPVRLKSISHVTTLLGVTIPELLFSRVIVPKCVVQSIKICPYF